MNLRTKISIVIVSFNTIEYTRACLKSVFDSSDGYNLEVFVIDNASTDGSSEMISKEFPQVLLTKNAINVGFSKSNNQALRKVSGEYVLLLNSDTIIYPGVLDSCVKKILQEDKVGALTVKVELMNGELDLACRRSFPTPWVAFWKLVGISALFPKSRLFSKYNLTYKDPDKSYEVDAIVGAFMFIPREVIDRVGYLDEQFFMYGEDLDWCYRIRREGYRILYYPEVKILHKKGASSRSRRPPKMVQEFHRAMRIFYEKYYARSNVFFINWMISLGVYTHFIYDSFRSLIFFLTKKKQNNARIS